jgi:hypothetical protein
MAKRKRRTSSRIDRKKRTGRKTRAAAKRRPVSRTRTTRKKQTKDQTAAPAKRPTVTKKRRAIEEKEREVDEARKRLLHAEASLAAEEIPELTKKE